MSDGADEQDLDHLARAILDGSEIDWDAEERKAGPGAARVHELRVLAQLATVHRGAPPTVETPGRWGPLTIVEKIGAGAFGEVYRAVDPRLARDVALKLLFPDSGVTDHRGAIEEGRLLARVRHPNVLTVYGAERIDGRIGIWTELIEGETLARAVAARGVFPVERAINIGIALCSALDAVHAAGLLHRDIKAQNVMHGLDGRIVLMDFGAGHEMLERERARRAGTPGTPLYVAPELWFGASPSPQSDIYAVGVLLYHLVTGEYPLRAQSVDGIAAAHRAHRYQRLADLRPDLPSEFVRVVQRALSSTPDARYDSAAAFGRALEHVLEEASGHVLRTVRRTAGPGFHAIALALIAACASLLWTMRPRTNDGGGPPTSQKLELLCNVECLPSPDGRVITHPADGDLWLWDVETGHSRRVTRRNASAATRGFFPSAVVSNDGRRIAYAWQSPDGQQELSVVDVDDVRPHTLVPLQAWPKWAPIRWSADRRHVLCRVEHEDGRHSIALVQAADGAQRILRTFQVQSLGASLSPDGRFLAYDQPVDASMRREIFVQDLGGTGSRALAPHPAGDSRPFWTADGRALLFSSDRSGANAEWLLPMQDGRSTGEPTLLARLPPRAEPFWLADTGSFFFWVDTNDVDVYLRPIDLMDHSRHGTTVRVDPAVTGGHSFPAWAPDGHELSFITKGQLGEKSLSVLDRASGAIRELPLSMSQQWEYLQWRPNRGCVAVHGADLLGRRGHFCVDVENATVHPVWVREVGSKPLPSVFEWSRDGQSLFYFDRSRGIVQRVVATGIERIVFDSPGNAWQAPGRIRVSPDGGTIAFNATRGQGKEAVRGILVKSAGKVGEEAKLVFTTGAGENTPIQSWTPDGREIVFSRFVPSQDPSKITYRLWAVAVSTGRTRDLSIEVPGLVWGHDIAFRPDGKEIAYAHFTNRRFSEMWVMRNILPRATSH